ncbi:PEPxxWA-CTERM sorting domain-containing protein [Polymorphobacter sp. PAMC 29334]|uniref:PEPxxWA-CTERM sorting domain-containing protein n=1 Tax=Polymorphobacter sp. PAMC 29334 TaxID=2862331 RepID=UPI001C775CAE|nr:PEPxxWA-CTERM sorting domain-containing protein [Polymorphobacter sp. PAMC 29334]QYE33826.1 PEPxxWA-CTERM sorting domain-containing protein [Polymorphobacter sp. PAMC 29334]
MRLAHTLVATTLLAAAGTASAANLVVNGSFESTDVSGKSYFASHVTGWSGGSNLTFVDFPGTADDGSYLSVYGPFPTTSPVGGNFVEADGDPSYSGVISQSISGLTAGKSYTVSFYQAAGQQVGFTGPTTEQWSVSLGESTQLSSLYSLPQGAVGGWQKQTMTFVAGSTNELLSFLAVGTPGGAPPISFLDGVSLTASVPEPATWALMVSGFGLVGGVLRRRLVATTA